MGTETGSMSVTFYDVPKPNITDTPNPEEEIPRPGETKARSMNDEDYMWKNVPYRYQPGNYDTKPKKQNPLYQTSNHSYGLKKPTERSCPTTYRGKPNSFTKGFTGFAGGTGFNTSTTRERYADTEYK
ncbi:hypothetical protein BLNAU_13106 [Blattamonas nauphoetae]|uniref:Uncharacterized protein n=1 Tax=Blattamonas nauphoetae TaxID=2049346 RepID=A0ABQ9XIZ8_9EUKA|nr:hypothetical protein BLNAU_13106 [Blattamonas nauphoetae]